MIRAIGSIVAVVAFAVLAPAEAIAAGLSAPFVTAAPGQTISVPVSVTNASALGFFQFDVDYDRSIVRADPAGATAGAMLPTDWFFSSPGIDDPAAGRILGISAFGTPVDGTGPVAQLRFTALALGVSPVDVSGTFLNLGDQSVELHAGRITVIVLPVPLSTMLAPAIAAVLGTLAWAGFRRRPRRTARSL